MILTIVATAALFAGSAGEPRQAYSACLRDAVANAKVAKVTGDGFKAYAHEAAPRPRRRSRPRSPRSTSRTA
jgi:hypothetical protein